MKFWKVTTRFFDNGNVYVKTEPVEATTMPESSSSYMADYDEYIDCFKTKKEAQQWAEDARNA